MHILNHTLQLLSVICLAIAFSLALLASWRFKDILIKLISLEVMVNLFICMVGIWALHIRFSLLLDICLALSLIMFLSTVAYCQFLMRRGHENA